MLKFQVSSLTDVDEAARPFYVKKADDRFELAVDGIDDTSSLRNALASEREERKTAKARVTELEEQLRTVQESARTAAQEHARNSADVRAIEDGWKKKHAEELAARDATIAAKDGEYKPQIEKLRGNLQRLLVENEAARIASAIAMPGCASILIPHLRQRLSMTERDGEQVTVVLDKAGKPTNLTTAEFQSQFGAEAEFAPVLIGGKGSGSGSAGAKVGGAHNAKTKTRADFDALTLNDRQAFIAGGGSVLQ